MSAVSVIIDYGWQYPDDYWDAPKWRRFERLLKEAAEFDKATEQPDCIDTTKAEWTVQV